MEVKFEAVLHLNIAFKALDRLYNSARVKQASRTLLIKLCEITVKLSCETVQTSLMWSYVTPSFHPNVFKLLFREVHLKYPQHCYMDIQE